MLLNKISPTAAKIYLVLSTLTKPNADPPIAQVPLKTLARLANLAPRTCSLALRQLLDLHLLTRLPRRDATPTAYILAPLHYTHLDAPTSPQAHPHAPLPTTQAHPDAPSPCPKAHPDAPARNPTPISSEKTHKAHEDAPHSTKPAEDPSDDPLLNPALLQFLMNSLSADEKSTLLAPLQPVLAALKKSTQGAIP